MATLLSMQILLSPAARGETQAIAVECRVGQGAWQTCQMEMVDQGRQWFVVVGQRRYAFQHDGTGHMRMGVGGGWQEVTPHWGPDQSLCWGTICVRGDIPLE